MLAALAVLHAAGWSAPQLATEACTSCARPSCSSSRLTPPTRRGRTAHGSRELGEALGLPRTVRALETLGRAMVEMRDAPDPTVVLEIALVRLARPELDPSPAALLERLERLEREGGPPSPRHPPPRSPAPPDARGLRPASRARAVDAATATSPTATSPTATSPTASPRTPGCPGAPAGHEPTGTAPAGAVPTGPDRDALTLAWGDTILESLSPALARSSRRAVRGRRRAVLHVRGRLPAQREQASTSAARWRRRSRRASAPRWCCASSWRRRRRARGPAPTPDEEPTCSAVDLDEMDGGSSHDTETIATARVLDAFPGATEVRS